MKYSLVAIHLELKEYVIIEKVTKLVKTVSEDFIYRNIKQIEGIDLKGKELMGTNGVLSRYDIKNNKLVILYKTDIGFVISNNKGEVVELNNQQALMVVGKYGLANGKIVDNRISAIIGNYEILEGGKENDQRRCKQVDRRNQQEGRKEREINKVRELDTRRSELSEERKSRSDGKINRRLQVLDGLKLKGYKNKVNAVEFYTAIEQAKESNKHGASVSLYSVEDYNDMNCVLFDDGKAGIAIKKDGDIISVFKSGESQLKGYMEDAMKAAVINGGKKLDCYSINGGLPKMYCTYGFIPICKIKFDREFAPDNWDYDRDGEPDIVFMHYCGDNVEDITGKTYKSYLEYTDEEVPYIEGTDKESAYEIAERFRDESIIVKEVNPKSQIDGFSSTLSNIFMKITGQSKGK